MSTIRRILIANACVVAVGITLHAQWQNHPTPGVSRSPDGKVNLAAEAPRASDGKPDLSGVWRVRQGSYLIHATADLKPEEMLPWAAAVYRQSADEFRRDSDGIKCLPPGPKASLSGLAFPMKIVQTPSVVVVLYEYQTIYRQIFIDGRRLPVDPNPTWMGYSVGRWEGDSLVVTTAGYNDRTSLDLAGHPHTEALHMTERFHRRDVGHIDVQVTFEDPKAYTRSWTLPVELDLMADSELIEYVCENERDSAHMVGKSGEEYPVPVEILAQYTGTYDAGVLGNIVVSLQANHLMINPGGAGNIPLVAHGENNFTMEGTGVEFVRDQTGAVVGMRQHWTEGDRNNRRKND
jgi:hypothetical protein